MRPSSIVAAYVVAGFAWIGLSDPLVDAFAPSSSAATVIDLAKGWAFVLVTGALLYLLICRYVASLEAGRRQLEAQVEELRSTAASLEHTEDRLRDALGRAGEATWEFDFDTRSVRLSDELRTVLGMPELPLVMSSEEWEALIHPADLARIREQAAQLLAGKIDHTESVYRQRKPGGGWRWLLFRGGIDRRRPGGHRISVGTVRDVTELHRRDEELDAANKALHALIAVNRVIVAASSRPELLGQICETLVRELSLRLVWIGEAVQDQGRHVKVVARAGADAAALDDVLLTWDESESGSGLSGRAIRTGMMQYTNDAMSDPRLESWRQQYRRVGAMSAAAIPIRQHGAVWGVLMAHGLDVDSFGSREREVMENLGADIGFATGVLNARAMAEISEKERVSALKDVHEGTLNAVRALASLVEARDPYTAGHQSRVAALAVRIGARLGLTLFELEGLQLGGMLHDIGKIGVPSEILAKPGRLSTAQLALVRDHPRIGRDVVQNLRFPWPIAEMIGQHHERLDGSGYPQGLKGDAICREAQIIAVADVAESMLSHRPYRPALSAREAVRELTEGRGTRYWAEAVDACLALMEAPDFTIQLGGGLDHMPAIAAAPE